MPGTNSTGSEFSPREQGAGLVNVKNVVTTKASPAPTARRSGPSARITCKAFFLSTYGIYRTQIISDGWTGRAWNEETEAYDSDYHASLSASIAKRKAFCGNLYSCNIL